MWNECGTNTFLILVRLESFADVINVMIMALKVSHSSTPLSTNSSKEKKKKTLDGFQFKDISLQNGYINIVDKCFNWSIGHTSMCGTVRRDQPMVPIDDHNYQVRYLIILQDTVKDYSAIVCGDARNVIAKSSTSTPVCGKVQPHDEIRHGRE